MRFPDDVIIHYETDVKGTSIEATVVGELIRCKDCKYNYGNKYECDYNHEDIVCTYWMSDGLTDYDFCSMAEEYKE